MSTTQQSSPNTNTVDLSYVFVWEKSTNEKPQHPGPNNYIHITSLDVDEDTQMTEVDDLEDLDAKQNPPESPESNCINTARLDNYIPCVANFMWHTYDMKFYCLYDKLYERFKRFELAEQKENGVAVDDWEAKDIYIGHTPWGFHNHVLEGTLIRDDLGKLMLFVKISPGNGWGARLYGKMAVEGESRAKLTEGEKGKLGFK